MEHFYQTIEGWFDFEDIYREMVVRAPAQAHFVEVGAFLGKSTSFLGVEIINSGKEIDLDVVDTFLGTSDTCSILREKMGSGNMFQQFKQNTRPIWRVLTVIPFSSLEAALRYEEHTLDFVFLDADHDYTAVSADIRAWLPKIRPGGYLGGHDYLPDWPGVVRAVDEFFGERKQVRGSSWLVSV